ncbi:hypothetical protein [Kitasatospora sp. NPDC088548]|uniref:hypothetical protein n=1 Tax=Kitasatospora sp. NPDC088548 TaxID=3364075 RepID=UPI00381B07F1
MQPPVTAALNRWHAAWSTHESAAQTAFTAAFPALNRPAPKCPCFGPTLCWETAGEGSGKVCLDDHGRATIDFADVPKQVLGHAMTTCYGADWFQEGAGGFAAAEPGAYQYEDESTYAEYAIDVNADGTADFRISYERVDNVVAILDLLETALADHRGGS